MTAVETWDRLRALGYELTAGGDPSELYVRGRVKGPPEGDLRAACVEHRRALWRAAVLHSELVRDRLDPVEVVYLVAHELRTEGAGRVLRGRGRRGLSGTPTLPPPPGPLDRS